MKWWQFREAVQIKWHDLMGYTLCRARGHAWRGVIHGWRCRRCNVFSSR